MHTYKQSLEDSIEFWLNQAEKKGTTKAYKKAYNEAVIYGKLYGYANEKAKGYYERLRVLNGGYWNILYNNRSLA